MNRRRDALRSSSLLLICLIVSAILTVAHAERPRIYALTGARVVVSPGHVIEDGTIVFRDGLIEAVGAGVRVPPEAEVIDGSGLWVTPALIDADTDLGRPTRTSSPSPTPRGPGPAAPGAGERPGAVHPIERVRPEARAEDRLAPFRGDAVRALERLREQGFAAVQTIPAEGIFRGRGAVILLLDEQPVSRLLLHGTPIQHVAFERGSFGEGYPTSLMGTVAVIRQAFLDASRHATWSRRYERAPSGMARPARSAAMTALRPAVEGQEPVFLRAPSPEDALLAMDLSAEFSLRAVIVGSGAQWEVAAQMSAARTPLVLPVAFPDKPDVEDEHERREVSLATMRRYLDAPAGPRRIHDAGVPFAFTARGLDRVSQLPENMRRIIKAGLPEEAALAAWTTVPARLLGIDAIVGTLDPGKIANIAVWDGAPFGESTKLTRLFIDGVEHRMKEKKKLEGVDTEAVIDPRGEWSVLYEFGPRKIERTWILEGAPGRYRGTAETQEGTVEFDDVRVEGNLMTVVFPARGGRPSVEVPVVITGDNFKGTLEFGPRSVPLRGTRTAQPDGEEGR